MLVDDVKYDLQTIKDPVRASFHQRYFKTGEGDYGAGDIFIGASVPKMRAVAKKYYKELALKEVEILLKDSIHEYRFTALEILVFKFENAQKEHDIKTQEKVFAFYLKHKKYINNWDLVDTSCRYILGGYLFDKTDKEKEILYTLAKSKNIWDRRIAIVSTFDFIVKKEYKDALKISEILLHDTHDLIHKAVGWMLREVGNRSKETEVEFLQKHYKTMPRTMLRYAIEKFPVEVRKMYLVK